MEFKLPSNQQFIRVALDDTNNLPPQNMHAAVDVLSLPSVPMLAFHRFFHG